MSKKRKVVKVIGGVMFTSGLLLLIGTAGSSDLGTMSFGDILIQSGLGLLLLGVGYFVIKLATGGGVYND